MERIGKGVIRMFTIIWFLLFVFAVFVCVSYRIVILALCKYMKKNGLNPKDKEVEKHAKKILDEWF